MDLQGKYEFFVYKGGARGSASGLRQGSALHPRRVFDPLDTLLAIELSALSYYARVLRRDFAPAGATRGLCDRPLDCFASPSKFIGCYRSFLVSVLCRSPKHGINQPQITPKAAAPKVSKGRSQTSSVFIALWCARRRTPLPQTQHVTSEKSSRALQKSASAVTHTAGTPS